MCVCGYANFLEKKNNLFAKTAFIDCYWMLTIIKFVIEWLTTINKHWIDSQPTKQIKSFIYQSINAKCFYFYYLFSPLTKVMYLFNVLDGAREENLQENLVPWGWTQQVSGWLVDDDVKEPAFCWKDNIVLSRPGLQHRHRHGAFCFDWLLISVRMAASHFRRLCFETLFSVIYDFSFFCVVARLSFDRI